MKPNSSDWLRHRLASVRNFIANGDTDPATGALQLGELEAQLTAAELREAAEAKATGLKVQDVLRAVGTARAR
jgi:hypothetical protein